MKGRVVASVGIGLHLPLAVLTVIVGMEEAAFMLLTVPSVAAAAVAAVGVVLARRAPRRGAMLVLVPGIASAAWIAFMGLFAPGALLFLLGVPLLPIGGWMMRREVPNQSPLPALPGQG